MARLFRFPTFSRFGLRYYVSAVPTTVFAQFTSVSTVSDVNGPFSASFPTLSRFDLRYHVSAIPTIVFAKFTGVYNVSAVNGPFLLFSDAYPCRHSGTTFLTFRSTFSSS